MAHETGLEPGRIHIVLGDAHIYDEHTTVARKQLERDPFPLPQLAPIIREHDELWGVKLEDAEIINYKSHGSLKAKMKA
jgi:thymidylate synthase